MDALILEQAWKLAKSIASEDQTVEDFIRVLRSLIQSVV